MPNFHYLAKNAQGKPVVGDMEAPDEKTVASTLRDHGLFILQIKEKRSKKAGGIALFDKMSESDVLNFTRQFSIMLTSGLSITESLTIMRSQSSKKSVMNIYDSIFRDVQGGQSLSKAFEKFPKVFSPTYTSLVKAGEASGLLEQIVTRLADTLEKQKEFKSKTRGALIYPAIVVIGMLGVILIMMIFVIPKLASIYENIGTELPLPTLILIAISTIMAKFWYLVFAGIIGSVVGFMYWKKTPLGNELLDSFFFRMPIFGPLRRINILTELTRTLGLLTVSGVPIIEALHIVSRTTGSVHYERDLSQAALQVEKGFTLAQSFDNEHYYPKIVSFMLRTGEETGKVGDVLLKLSHYYEIEAEQRIKNLTVAMEPIIMIVLGVGVGFLILSIILPIYKLTSSF